MSMRVEILKDKTELDQTAPFRVECLLWGTRAIPVTYGYLGFVRGEGFYLKMVCEEKDPPRTYVNAMDPVYRDSAMEAFFQFEPKNGGKASSVYLNFEVNGNGALLAGYGSGRIYRTYFCREEVEIFDCKARVDESQWEFSLHIPIEVLERIYGSLELEEGSVFKCNFYKISESKEIEHYASCFLIDSKTPSFHLPEYFGKARLCAK